MNDDRERDERVAMRDFDSLLQIAHRAEVPVPAGVATAAFDRAFAQRRAGLWDGFVPGDDIDAGESYSRAVEQFHALARGLSDREWQQPVATYGSVHNLVSHLLAIEIYTGRQLGLFPDHDLGDEGNHVRVGDAVVARLQSTEHASVLESWHDHARQIVVALTAQPQLSALPASWHGAAIDVHALLVIRTFELWTHADDVRVATGRARGEPDNAQLKLMTNLAAEILPLGLELIGRPHPGRTVRLVLTGRGGGTWRRGLSVGSAPGVTDDVVLVADAVGFCRLAANRCTPAELDAYVEGDGAVASDILEGMTALAAD